MGYFPGGIDFVSCPTCSRCKTDLTRIADEIMAQLGGIEKDMLERPPLEIGHDVWIGANAIILPGVSRIGNGAVIGAGSVVTRSIPANVVAVGVPCRVLRVITPDEKKRYPTYRE